MMDEFQTIVRQRSEHSLSRKLIDDDALKVLYRLSRNGFTAHLVGGGVRDLLLGKIPKDFDIATDAHPRQIKKLFSNCFLVGRRFRLAHIRFNNNKVIETCTFRREPDEDQNPSDPEADLYRYRDNCFGTPEEDAFRRDFTINGLFYDIKTFSVIDHVGGLEDLESGIIRSIGDPNIRFREDPVRMLRAVRFSSRLGFTIEPETFKAILTHHSEILKASTPRLLEEIYRLFHCRAGEQAFRLLAQTGLMTDLFPELAAYIDRTGGDVSPFWPFLAGLDASTSYEGNPSPALIFGSLLYPLVMERLEDSGDEPLDLARVAEEVFAPMAARFQVPRLAYHRTLLILSGQRKLEPHRRKRFSKGRFAAQETFLETLILYEIAVQAGVGDAKVVEAWREILGQCLCQDHPAQDPDQPDETPDSETTGGVFGLSPSRPPRRKRPRRPKPDAQLAATDEAQPTTMSPPTDNGEGGEPRRKRRRGKRKRKSGGASSDGEMVAA